MLNLPPHRPKYIIGCDVANGKDSQVTIAILKNDGVIEYIIDRDNNFCKMYKDFMNFKDQ